MCQWGHTTTAGRLSASPTTYFMSVHSFIQLILIELPLGDWQRNNACYWTSRRENYVTHLTVSVCFHGGILKQDIVCGGLPLLMKLMVLEGLLAQDCFRGLAFYHLFKSDLFLVEGQAPLQHKSVDYKWAYRPLKVAPYLTGSVEPRSPG